MSGGVVVIRKSTGLPVIEMFAGDPDIQRVNTELFTVVPVLEYLQTLNNMSHYTIESGNVLLPRDAPWLSDFLAESSAFPNGVHDDMLDPMFDAVSDMTTPSDAERMLALIS